MLFLKGTKKCTKVQKISENINRISKFLTLPPHLFLFCKVEVAKEGVSCKVGYTTNHRRAQS